MSTDETTPIQRVRHPFSARHVQLLAREAISPGSLPYQALLLVVAAAFYISSWLRGGQTLGMRPWRLRVRTADGDRPRAGALWLRFAVGTVSLLAGGLGFWWAWWDRDRLAWHDRASGTRLVRLPKPNP